MTEGHGAGLVGRPVLGASRPVTTLRRMTTPGAPNPILEAARQLQEAKLAAVQKLAETRARIGEIDVQRTEAVRADAVAYQQAIRGGWTEAELRQVGITPPERKAPGRPPRGSGGQSTKPPGPGEVERSGAAGLVESQLQREAEASTRMDREGDGQTHVVG